MRQTRAVRTKWRWLGDQLKVLYGRWAGELRWIENPPKSMGRKWRGRDAFHEDADARKLRAEQIREALPHSLYVIRIVDPTWGPESAQLVRPRKVACAGPSIGWAEAALDVLRRAEGYMSISEIVEEIARRRDEVDLMPTGARQNAAIAVSATLLKTYRHLLVADPTGARWALTSHGATSED